MTIQGCLSPNASTPSARVFPCHVEQPLGRLLSAPRKWAKPLGSRVVSRCGGPLLWVEAHQHWQSTGNGKSARTVVMQKSNVFSACSTASSGSSTAVRGCVRPFLIFRSAANATSSIGDRDNAASTADNRGPSRKAELQAEGSCLARN